MKDVAAKAGVSAMTVSNVVNGKFNQVSGTTRKKVEKAIQQLGYRTQSTGRQLRLAHQFTIGMAVFDTSSRFLADPFITQIVSGLSNFLSERDYALVLQRGNPGRLRDLSLFKRQSTDALCVMLSGSGTTRRSMVADIVGLGHPVVLFQEYSEPSSRLQVIRQNDFEGAKQLALHVLKRTQGEIWFLVPMLEWPAIVERKSGIRAAISSVRDSAHLEVIPCGGGGFAETFSTVSHHLSQRPLPAAIMGGNDQMGIAALKCLQSRGIRTPQDVAVTGYNAFETWEYTTPTLTSVYSPAYEMGAIAGASILNRLQSGKYDQDEIVLPVAVRLGESA